jgi:hypothetical protein
MAEGETASYVVLENPTTLQLRQCTHGILDWGGKQSCCHMYPLTSPFFGQTRTRRPELSDLPKVTEQVNSTIATLPKSPGY